MHRDEPSGKMFFFYPFRAKWCRNFRPKFWLWTFNSPKLWTWHLINSPFSIFENSWMTEHWWGNQKRKICEKDKENPISSSIPNESFILKNVNCNKFPQYLAMKNLSCYAKSGKISKCHSRVSRKRKEWKNCSSVHFFKIKREKKWKRLNMAR
jgi:hypothetical protein